MLDIIFITVDVITRSIVYKLQLVSVYHRVVISVSLIMTANPETFVNAIIIISISWRIYMFPIIRVNFSFANRDAHLQ